MTFPFLIGKVLTRVFFSGRISNKEIRFPFLIGKVLTNGWDVVIKEGRNGHVSIPYR